MYFTGARFKKFLLRYVRDCVRHHTRVEARGQLVGVSSALSQCVSQGSNSGPQAL